MTKTETVTEAGNGGSAVASWSADTVKKRIDKIIADALADGGAWKCDCGLISAAKELHCSKCGQSSPNDSGQTRREEK